MQSFFKQYSTRAGLAALILTGAGFATGTVTKEQAIMAAAAALVGVIFPESKVRKSLQKPKQ